MVEALRHLIFEDLNGLAAGLTVGAAVALGLLGIFLAFAVAPYVWTYRVAPAWLTARRLSPRRPRAWDEAAHTLSSMAIYGLLSVPLVWLMRQGYGRIDWSEPRWPQVAVAFVAFVLVHDAWFYWTHRLLHTRTLARIHAAHHRSVAPTSLAVFSFHPLEAVVQYGVVYVFFFFVPAHIYVYVLWIVFQAGMSAMGHSGVELYPKSHLRTPGFRHVLCATHHSLHHRDGRHNFGLFFTFWDRVCGTEDARYTALRGVAVPDVPLTRPDEQVGG